ncbi:hypothetical protein PMAYCL1PPCAC_01907, partial [Pristionchus mayeri]
KEEYDEMLQKRREAAIEKRREDEEENEKKKEELIAKGIPAQFHPHVPEEGPEPCKKWVYDPCNESSFSAREREWKFMEWTEKYLLARVKLGISVEDACKHVHNGLLDNGFIYGEECPTEHAVTMFNEWADMMAVQDRMDFAPNTRAERRFIENLPAGFKEDMQGLPVASRIKEAPIHPKKRSLLKDIIPMFSFTCPEEREVGLALTRDQFGLPEEVRVAKDLPVITRTQEERMMELLEKDKKKDNIRWNKIYSDDAVFQAEDEPYYNALKETFNIQEAFPEGPD